MTVTSCTRSRAQLGWSRDQIEGAKMRTAKILTIAAVALAAVLLATPAMTSPMTSADAPQMIEAALIEAAGHASLPITQRRRRARLWPLSLMP
jgi:hypothetical protein